MPYAQGTPGYQGAPQVQAIQQVVVPKNPAVGVILSFFIPGLGSMVNGSGGRGATILGLYMFGWILAFFLIGIPILIGVWIWGMVDGYLSAQRWNLAHGIVS
jgi:TM2 domain-containing membrane protein YozV